MNDYDNIILGAGPAGLQCAYFFMKHNINYVILEKNNLCGSFFDLYPHSGNLISINKKYTGSNNDDFNLRHDWNSLLTDDKFFFTEYTSNYYPKKECLVNYLNDFYSKYKLNVVFGTNIISVEKNSDDKFPYILSTESNKLYRCKKLIIATGLSKVNIPDFDINVINDVKHYGQYPKNFFKDYSSLSQFINKDVCLIGGGNASYELAIILNEYCKSVTIFANGHRHWSMSSHYSGDIRSVYLPFVDTFLLKSLNAIDKSDRTNKKTFISQTDNNGKYKLKFLNFNNEIINYSNIDYDHIIFCTGWKFDNSIFNFAIDMINNKFPCINNLYESTNNKDLFFIGSLMHSLDYRKSSGGFIHGFRYLIRSFIQMNYTNFDHSVFDLITELDYRSLVKHILNRFNTSSSIYQMFGVLSDTFFLNKEKKQVFYIQDVPVTYYEQIDDPNILRFVLTLEYGNEIICDVSKLGNKFSTVGTECKSSLIHPVIKVFNYNNRLVEIIHLDEELYASFIDENLYYKRISRLLKSYCI